MSNNNAVRSTKRNEGSRVGSLMLVFVAFVFGYLVATVFDIKQMHNWVNTKMQVESGVPSSSASAKKKATSKPKLEFYTLLSQDNHKRNEPPLEVRVDPNPPKDLNTTTKHLPVPSTMAAADKTAVKPRVTQDVFKYMLQVGSFKSKVDAERLRADLVIKGFDVILVSVNHQQGQWYRVMVGPVPSKKEAESLKSSLASRENIHGMIRRVEV